MHTHLIQTDLLIVLVPTLRVTVVLLKSVFPLLKSAKGRKFFLLKLVNDLLNRHSIDLLFFLTDLSLLHMFNFIYTSKPS